MPIELSALDPKEIVLAAIVLIGVVPVALQYRSQSKWFVVGYACLVVGALATNAEALVFGGLLNGVEHVVGLMGAGIAFAVAAYVRRRDVVLAEEEIHG